MASIGTADRSKTSRIGDTVGSFEGRRIKDCLVIRGLRLLLGRRFNRQSRGSGQGAAAAAPASGITCIRTAGRTEISPVKGRLWDAISTTAIPTLVAKIPMMMRLARRLS